LSISLGLQRVFGWRLDHRTSQLHASLVAVLHVIEEVSVSSIFTNQIFCRIEMLLVLAVILLAFLVLEHYHMHSHVTFIIAFVFNTPGGQDNFPKQIPPI
jgi:hypothetical protein